MITGGYHDGQGAAVLGPPSIAIRDAAGSEASRVPLANSKFIFDTFLLNPISPVFGGGALAFDPLDIGFHGL
jgi:hypothetical protein